MDAATTAMVAAAVSGVAGSVATEAGSRAWEGLRDLCRRVGGRGTTREIAVPEDAGDGEQVRVLTTRLIEEGRRDEDFAAALRAWAERHEAVARSGSGDVNNTISGNAQVSGTVIQARDISGDIRLGGS
jgi:hypothetical protein